VKEVVDHVALSRSKLEVGAVAALLGEVRYDGVVDRRP